jgi:hypothetical protein
MMIFGKRMIVINSEVTFKSVAIGNEKQTKGFAVLTTTEVCLARMALMLEDIKKIKKTDISKVQLPEKPSRVSSF